MGCSRLWVQAGVPYVVAHEGTKLALARSVGSSVMGAGTMSGFDCSMQLTGPLSLSPAPPRKS